MKGIVDELRLDDLGKIVIVEVKSRRSNSLPSDAQKRTAELQVWYAQPPCNAGMPCCFGCCDGHI